MRRCFPSLDPFPSQIVFPTIIDGGIRGPVPPSSFSDALSLLIEVPTHGYFDLVALAKASVTVGASLVITDGVGDTHAFWFDTTGADPEPAEATAADNAYPVDISALTTNVQVAAALVTEINLATLGATAVSTGGGGLSLVTDTAGPAGFDGWALVEHGTGISFVPVVIGVAADTVLEASGTFWLGGIAEDVEENIEFTLENNSEIDFDFRDAIAAEGETVDATNTTNATMDIAEPADDPIPSGDSVSFNVGITAADPGYSAFRLIVWQGDGEGAATEVVEAFFKAIVS